MKKYLLLKKCVYNSIKSHPRAESMTSPGLWWKCTGSRTIRVDEVHGKMT